MNEQQAYNTLAWIEALLSGKYPWGYGALYNAETDCWDAIGVAMEINDLPIIPDTRVLRASLDRSWEHEAWFHTHFGLRSSPGVYASISDHSKNHLSVAALLLDAVPGHSAAIRTLKRELNAVMQHQMNEVHRR